MPNSTFGERLKSIRLARSLSQEELAKILKTSKQVISRYESNQRTPKITTALDYAALLGVDFNYLIGDERTSDGIPYADNIIPMPSTKKVPRLGAIACGEPILAVENHEDYDEVPDYVKCDFTLKCKGDSMVNARIYDGDIVCIRQQSTVDNGEIAAVIIDDEATLKRVKFAPGQIILWPENPNYEPLIFVGEQMNAVRILGKATHFISVVK